MDAYIEELTGIIKDTIIVDPAENKTYDYEEGIKRLVTLFTKRKKSAHTSSLSETAEAPRSQVI